MANKKKHHLDSSSDGDDDNNDYSRGFNHQQNSPSLSPQVQNHINNNNNQTATAPFQLQVPATYANKHPALVDRNGLVSSSLSEKASISNSHRVPQKKSETWKRPDLLESRFQGTSETAEAKIFGPPVAAFGDLAPSCASPRVALPPVQHKFRLAAGGAKNNNNNNTSSNKNNTLIPALVLPQHNAQKILERDFDLVLEANKLNSTTSSSSRNISRMSGAQVRTLPLPSTSSLTSGNLHTMEKEKKLLSQTARSRPPPPPFSSVKIDAHSNAAGINSELVSYLDDKHAEDKINALKASKGKILYRQQQQQQSQSPSTSRAGSKLSNNQYHSRETSLGSTNYNNNNRSVSNSSSSMSNKKRNGGKRVYASSQNVAPPPNENDYIEDSQEDPTTFKNNQEWTQHALDKFDYQTLPPVIEATKKQQESLGKNVGNTAMLNISMSETGSYSPPGSTQNKSMLMDLDDSVAVPNAFASALLLNKNGQQQHNSPHQSPILLVNANNNGITAEAATGRVARTLFHAGLCQNLLTFEKLKTKISPQDLEKRLQNDFMHRRQVSKEDFVAFLSRVLKEDHVNRREADMLWTMLDSNGNGVLESRELRTELVKFVKSGMRDISFGFVAQLLEGKETTACNAFISRFDIQNIVNAITTFYKDDKDVCDAVRDLPDKFQYNHHLARIPIAVLRDRILGDRKLLSIFQAVALEARKNKLEENAAKGITNSFSNGGAALLGHFAPMSIPQSTSNSKNNTISNGKGITSLNNTASLSDSVMLSGTMSGVVSKEASLRQKSNNSPLQQQQHASPPPMSIHSTNHTGSGGFHHHSLGTPTASNLLGNNNLLSTSTNTSGGAAGDGTNNNSIFLVGPNSEKFVDQYGEMIGTQKRRTSRQHNLMGGSVRVENNNNNSKAGHGQQQQNTNNQQQQATIITSNSRRSSLQSNGLNNNNSRNLRPANQNNNNNKPLRRKPSNISQQLAQFDHDSNSSPLLETRSMSSSSLQNQRNGGGPESSSAAGIVRMIHNPITNADRFVCSDTKRQDEAVETGNPRWYTKANVLYVETSNDNRQARPVFQAFA